MQHFTEDQMRELQIAYNESIITMLAKKRTCGPNCKLYQKEKQHIDSGK
jgi:hypothetical protein